MLLHNVSSAKPSVDQSKLACCRLETLRRSVGSLDIKQRMRTAHGMTLQLMKVVFSLFVVLLAASDCQAAGVNQTGTAQSKAQYVNQCEAFIAFLTCFQSDITGVNSTELQVVASQPQMVSCESPSPLAQYDSYCEGLQADYFLLPKQKKAPSLTGLTPNVSTYVTSLNDTVSSQNLA